MCNLGKIEHAITVIEMLDLRGVFDIDHGIAEKILKEESMIEKIKFLLYLQGQVFQSEIQHDEKFAYLGMFNIFMNVCIHGEIEDEEFEDFRNDVTKH